MKLKIIFLLICFSFFSISCKTSTFKNQQKKLQLIGNPSTGYTWIYKIEDKSIINIEEDVEYTGKEGLVGAPSNFIYTITSLKSGTTNLSFEYKRPWENNIVKEKLVYKIIVKEDGKILLKEEK